MAYIPRIHTLSDSYDLEIMYVSLKNYPLCISLMLPKHQYIVCQGIFKHFKMQIK